MSFQISPELNNYDDSQQNLGSKFGGLVFDGTRILGVSTKKKSRAKNICPHRLEWTPRKLFWNNDLHYTNKNFNMDSENHPFWNENTPQKFNIDTKHGHI